MLRLLDHLAAIVGPTNVLKGADEMAPFLDDWRDRYHGSAQCVVLPGNTREVAAVVAACAEAKVGIVPQGGNTGLVGGGIPSGNEVLISLKRMNRVISVDADNNTMTLEAGCTQLQAQEAAASVNRLYPVSFASKAHCTIGGNISTNAGGVQVLRYGNTRDQVLGLEVVLPDGRVWDGRRALRKDNSGYDLKHLFIGAEGTLGLVTSAVVKILPRPQVTQTAWVGVASPQAAVKLLSRLREVCGDRVTVFELMSRVALDLVFKHIEGAVEPLPQTTQWQVLLELADTWAAAPLAEMLKQATASLAENGEVLGVNVAADAQAAAALWKLRLGIPDAQKLEGFSIKHDVSVPVSAVPAFIEQADAALSAAYPGVRIVCFGHLGDGNLHYNQSSPLGDSAVFLKETEQVNRIVHDLVHSFGGSIAAEHGVGQLKAAQLNRYKSKVELSLLSLLKQSIDPGGLMNPGKVIEKKQNIR